MAIFISEIASKMVIEQMSKRLVISNLATDISKSISDLQWQGQTINFPVFERTAVAEEVADNGSVTPSSLNGSNSQSIIKHIAASVKFHKQELKYAGNQIADLAINDVAAAMALHIDSDIMSNCIENATLKKAVAKADEITASELLQAFSLFGDKQNTNEFAGIVINSKLLESFYAMPEFTSTALTYTAQNNGVIHNQVVGYFRGGIPVYLTDNGNRFGTTAECKTLVIKTGALGRALKQNVEFVEQYNNTTFFSTITADTYQSNKIMDNNGIVLLAKTIT